MINEKKSPQYSRTHAWLWWLVGISLATIVLFFAGLGICGMIGIGNKDNLSLNTKIGVQEQLSKKLKGQFLLCPEERLEGVKLYSSDKSFSSNGNVLWGIRSQRYNSTITNVTIGETPPGFVETSRLKVDFHAIGPLIIPNYVSCSRHTNLSHDCSRWWFGFD